MGPFSRWSCNPRPYLTRFSHLWLLNSRISHKIHADDSLSRAVVAIFDSSSFASRIKTTRSCIEREKPNYLLVCLAIGLDLGKVDCETAGTAGILSCSLMSIGLHSSEHDDSNIALVMSDYFAVPHAASILLVSCPFRLYMVLL